MSALPETLARFLEQYREAWNALDVEKIAGSYLVPAAIRDRDGAQVYASRGALLTKFERGVETVRDMGFVSSSFVVLLHYPLGSDAAAVDLDWQLRTSAAAISYRTLYVCHHTDNGWRIHAAHGYAATTAPSR